MINSMIFTKSAIPIIYQKIRIGTKLHGVDCTVYYPEVLPDGFQNYGDILYSTTPFLEDKLLIPKVVEQYSKNPDSQMIFMEEDVIMWSSHIIPRFSKIVVNENISLLSFIISSIETFKDTRDKSVFYKYTLVPSSSVPNESGNDVLEVVEEENKKLSDSEFEPSIVGINKISTIVQNSKIRFNRL